MRMMLRKLLWCDVLLGLATEMGEVWQSTRTQNDNKNKELLRGIQLCVVLLSILYPPTTQHCLSVNVVLSFAGVNGEYGFVILYPPASDCYYFTTETATMIPSGVSVKDDGWRCLWMRRCLYGADRWRPFNVLETGNRDATTAVQIIKIIISLQLSQS